MIEVAMSTLFTDYFAGPTWEKKIVGTGTDGASTKVGENNGFAAKLQQRLDRPELVAVHCSAHRNELAYWLAGYSCTRKLMHCSFLCISSIETAPSTGAASNKLGETHCIPSRVGETRWVPHKSSFQCAEGMQGTCDPFIPGDEPGCSWKDNRAARKGKELLRTATFQGCRVLPPLPRRCNCNLE